MPENWINRKVTMPRLPAMPHFMRNMLLVMLSISLIAVALAACSDDTAQSQQEEARVDYFMECRVFNKEQKKYETFEYEWLAMNGAPHVWDDQGFFAVTWYVFVDGNKWKRRLVLPNVDRCEMWPVSTTVRRSSKTELQGKTREPEQLSGYPKPTLPDN